MPRRPATALAVSLLLSLALTACGGGSTTSTRSADDGAGSGSASTSPPATTAQTGSPSAPAPTAPGDTPQPSATGGPPIPAPSPTEGGGTGGAFLEVVRSGGIAGVRDIVRVAEDGTAKLLTRDGRSRTCRPAADDVRRLRRMDLAALSALPSSPPVNDGFVFSVRTSHGAALAGDADKTGRRADLLDAAAGVVAACLAGQPASGGGKL